jgi:hypothetical protein
MSLPFQAGFARLVRNVVHEKIRKRNAVFVHPMTHRL